MTYTPKPPDPGTTGDLPDTRVRGAWGAKPNNDADLTLPDTADNAMTGANDPLLYEAEDALAADDARAARAEEARLASTDRLEDLTGTDDGEDEFVPPTDAGTIDAVADADTVLAAADLDMYSEIRAPEGATDAELAEAVAVAAALQEAVVQSAIADAVEQAAEIAAETGEAVVVVVEDEVIGVASPADREGDAADTADADAPPGIFGQNISAYATDADDPLLRMLHVQKLDPVDTPANASPADAALAARMDDEGDEVDADAALSSMGGGMAGSPVTHAKVRDADAPSDVGSDDPAPGVFGGNVTVYATDADDPAMRMLNVQKRGTLSRDDADDAPPLHADATDTLDAMRDAAGMRGLRGEASGTPSLSTSTASGTNRTPDGRESDPLDEGGIATTTPEPDDADGRDDARPLLDETTDDTAPTPEYEPESAADMGAEDPSPVMGEEMFDVVERDAPTRSDATASTPPYKAVQETGGATDVVRFAAPAAVSADLQGGDADDTVDTADDNGPPPPEPMTQFVAGGAMGGASTTGDAQQARESTDAGKPPVAPPPATPAPADEPPGELTGEELEQAREDTEGAENAPDSPNAAPVTTAGQSQSQWQSSATGAGHEMMTEAAPPAFAPSPAPTVLTPEELTQASMDNDSGATRPGSADPLMDSLHGVGVAAATAPVAETPADNGGASMPRVRHDVPLMTADDLYLFNEGTHTRLYEKLGSRPRTVDGVAGTHFAVWAPNARTVSVIGPFNGWVGVGYDLARNGSSGIWEGFIPGLGAGVSYKYHIASNYNMYEVDKADPFAVHAEVSPRTASVVWDAAYEWQDDDWMRERGGLNSFTAPTSVYEVHLGSWRRVPEDDNRYLTYRELAPQLADYVQECGFTHVEFLPVMEHPFYGSWGYQVTGYFAPTSRYGTPQEFAYLVDYLHQRGIGVILDWVPSHFPTDQHGLDYFDGTHLYEHADPRQGFHPDWKSDVFNYGRNEVRSFLMSSATYWLDRFHADGLRVDGVASMLYLDYSRNPGEWVPNRHGGRENLEAVSLLKELNTAIYSQFPSTQTTAEESTSWPMVSRPTYIGGLGFGMKWDMGWMHDTLEYMSLNPIHRQYHHNALTFRMLYAYFENFVLPLSHDEVVYLKGSLIQKMGGDDDWQKFANLRLLFGYQWAQSGKKLLFMGGEFAQWHEWDHDTSLDWHLLDNPAHQGIKAWVSDLNRVYRDVPALHQRDFDRSGFEWIDANDSAQSVASFIRWGDDREDPVVIAANFTPVPRHNYRLGVPFAGRWNEILNSDATQYGGSGVGNMGGVEGVPAAAHGRPQSLTVTVPPLGVVFFRRAYGS